MTMTKQNNHQLLARRYAEVTSLRTIKSEKSYRPMKMRSKRYMNLRTVVPVVLMAVAAYNAHYIKKAISPRQPKFEFKFEPLYDDSIKDPFLRELFQRLDRIRGVCGQLCENANSKEEWMKNSVEIDGAKVRLTLAPDLNCPALLQNTDVDASDSSVPYPPPDKLIEFYSMGGGADFNLNRRWVDVYLGGEARTNKWTEEVLANAERSATYGASGVHYVRGKLEELQIGNRKHALVIGSEKPWVEAILLSLGVPKITTLEYGSIESTHPQITTLTPDQMRQKYSAGQLEKFDLVVTHSSIEHSGLGRYGDALNPWGDILAIARAWCLTTNDAIMYLGVPLGKDSVQFNAHRVYGKMRWSLLATNWEQIDGATHPEVKFSQSHGRSTSNGGFGLLFRKVTDFSKYKTEESL